jgi:hypothetical protein
LPNVDEEVSPKIENGTMQGNGEDKST